MKANYIDGTQSTWSKAQKVTLFENGHAFVAGDVNHDGIVTIDDVSYLIDYLLSDGGAACPICADLDGNGVVSIDDMAALIDKLLKAN